MDKLPMTKEEIERLIIADLHTFRDCDKASGVVVVPIVDHASVATWTVSRFHAGGSDGEACDRALQHIVPLFQRLYDLVRKHLNICQFARSISETRDPRVTSEYKAGIQKSAITRSYEAFLYHGHFTF
jgi:hypothetical protein